jgi:hypothetical protein
MIFGIKNLTLKNIEGCNSLFYNGLHLFLLNNKEKILYFWFTHQSQSYAAND